MVVLEAVLRGVLSVLDVRGKSVGGANGVLAGDDGNGREVGGAAVNALGDDGGNKPQDVRTDRASDDVGSGNLLDEVLLVGLRVDGAVVGDDVLVSALGADLDDTIRGGGVEGVDQGIGDVSEDDLVARVVEEAGDEATA